MEWTGLNELREKYLNFFESKGHLKLKSFSLIPNNDNSLLLINSGMAPMKKYFTGEVVPPQKRVTTCQKCIRTPDIERVGITDRHGTFFEMLGNFSFGDYFKKDAIAWCWEFCVDVLKMPIDRLWISIYEDDDETFDIWTKDIGVDPSHVVRLGKEDNFWEHGSGPCGPCSEIYFDRGKEYGCSNENCSVGCECDRYIEFWNLVFTQFSNDGNGNYTPLQHPNIDTGMGLERLACIMQGVDNLFLVDTVKAIIDKVCKIAGVKYGENKKLDVSIRVITDHIRSTTFMIGDGIMPSNEGRGYVLRRLLRRAARHGKLLGIKGTFLTDICDTVIKENEKSYPELTEKKEIIKKVIGVEEEAFFKTLDQGMQILTNIIDNADFDVLSGEDAFKLNDTFGFPLDLTKEIIAEKGMTVDEEKFKILLSQQKERARNARKKSDTDAWISNNIDFNNILPTEFYGYNDLSINAEVKAIVKNGKIVEYASEGDKVIIVLDKTPFYAESGGQVGDSGEIESSNVNISVIDTIKNSSGIYMHSCIVNTGIISCGDTIRANVDILKRQAIMRNHTAAHMLQAALREVLGTHVEQAGQLVNDKHLRFDFTHFSAMTAEQIEKVENIVNSAILSSKSVVVKEMPIVEAQKLGAMALFGEKYGDVVRVVNIKDFSIEFCAGTHVDNTSKLGLFKIISEGSVASGIRRIEAVTGEGVLNVVNSSLTTIRNCAEILKIKNPNDILNRCISINNELKEKDKKIEVLTSKLSSMKVDGMLEVSKIIEGVRIVTANFLDEEMHSDDLRKLCNKLKDKGPKCVAVIVSKNKGKITFAVSVGKEAISKGLNAGKIIKEVAEIAGGKGGGKPDFAMAGAKDEAKISEALDSVQNIVLNMLK